MPNYPGDTLKETALVGTPVKLISKRSHFYYLGFLYYLSSELGRQRIWLIDVSYTNVSSDVQKYNSRYIFIPNFWYIFSASSTSVPTGKSVEGYTGIARLEGQNYLDKIDFLNTWTQTIGVITKTYDELNNPIFFNRVDGVIGYAWDPNEDRKNVTEASSLILNVLKLFKQRRYSIWLER
jgi:hypothetical protein